MVREVYDSRVLEVYIYDRYSDDGSMYSIVQCVQGV